MLGLLDDAQRDEQRDDADSGGDHGGVERPALDLSVLFFSFA